MATMFQDKCVFSQLTAILNRTQFNNYVRKPLCGTFNLQKPVLTMMFRQLSNRDSLRNLIVTLEAYRVKHYHLELSRKLLSRQLLPQPTSTVITECHQFYKKDGCQAIIQMDQAAS